MSKLGVLYFNSGSPLYYGKDIGYDWCAYPTATLAVSFGEPFNIKFTKNTDDWILSRSHVIKKGVLRTSISSESKCLVLYLTQGSHLHHFLEKYKLGEKKYADLSEYFDSKNLNKLKKLLKDTMTLEEVNFARNFVAELITENLQEKRQRDARIEKAMKLIHDTVNHETENITVAEIAKNVNLSPSRLQHLFKEDSGHTIQSFTQGVKTVKFFRTICEAKTLTEAAHMCGFTDASHMNHIIKKLYGVKPSIYFSGSKNDYIEIKFLSNDLLLNLY